MKICLNFKQYVLWVIVCVLYIFGFFPLQICAGEYCLKSLNGIALEEYKPVTLLIFQGDEADFVFDVNSKDDIYIYRENRNKVYIYSIDGKLLHKVKVPQLRDFQICATNEDYFYLYSKEVKRRLYEISLTGKVNKVIDVIVEKDRGKMAFDKGCLYLVSSCIGYDLLGKGEERGCGRVCLNNVEIIRDNHGRVIDVTKDGNVKISINYGKYKYIKAVDIDEDDNLYALYRGNRKVEGDEVTGYGITEDYAILKHDKKGKLRCIFPIENFVLNRANGHMFISARDRDVVSTIMMLVKEK